MNNSKEWYDVSLSPVGEAEWDTPVSILAISPVIAAEERLAEAAKFCDDWLESEWDAHVTLTSKPLVNNWYYRLAKPIRRVETRCLGQIFPEGEVPSE